MRKKRPTPSAPLVAAASVASVAADRAPFARVLSYTYSAAPDVSPSDVRTTARAGKAASGTGGVRGGWWMGLAGEGGCVSKKKGVCLVGPFLWRCGGPGCAYQSHHGGWEEVGRARFFCGIKKKKNWFWFRTPRLLLTLVFFFSTLPPPQPLSTMPPSHASHPWHDLPTSSEGNAPDQFTGAWC